MAEQHTVLAGSDRPRKRDAERVSDLDPASQVEVTLTLRSPELPGLDTGRPAMSGADLQRSYSASSDDIATVESVLGRFGLEVLSVTPLGHSMRVSGTAAQIESAFQAGLGVYRSAEQREFRGRERDVRIPAELDGIVTGVFGLDQRRVARRAGSDPAAAKAPAAQIEGLSPGQLEQRYSFPPGRGTGQKVGIAEFGGAYFPEDLEAFCKQHEIAMPQVSTIDAGVQPRTPEEVAQLPAEARKEALEASGEVMLDIEILAGFCPDAEIFVYFSSFDQKGWIDLLDLVVTSEPHVPVLSVSWGLAEDSSDWSTAAVREINKRLQVAAQMGITVCVASGDDGSGDQVHDGRAHVNFPATSPFVLSVGGTMIEADREVVWREPPGWRPDGGATGGGVSTIFARPGWQTVGVESLNENAIDGRVVPDIAALAGVPGYDVVLLGERVPEGGTSAATPLWAALIARLLEGGKPTKGPTFLAPLLYEPAGTPRGLAACDDITEGNNTSEPQPGVGYEATAGFDAVSGWGTPNGERLLELLP